LNETHLKPLKPADKFLPECGDGKYTTFGQNKQIVVQNCMSPPPSQPAPCAQVAQHLPPLPPFQPACGAQVAQELSEKEYASGRMFFLYRMNFKSEGNTREGKFTIEISGEPPFKLDGEQLSSSSGEVEYVVNNITYDEVDFFRRLIKHYTLFLQKK
jgi:hypothetical protein